MAKNKITYDEYLDIIIKKAAEAAKARANYNKGIWGEDWSKDPYASTLKYANEYREALKKKKPFSEITEKELSDISEFPDEAVMQWVDGNFKGPSPWEVQKSIEASKIFPLLLGAAEDGKDWYSRSAIDLQGIGKKDFGYNTSTSEGFQDFLKLLGDYQQQYDRANLLKEAQDSTTAYGLKRLITPTAWKEFENALASGGDYDKGDAVRSGAIDALANSVIIGGPTAMTRVPGATRYFMQVTSPVTQMVGEELRQIAAEQLSKNGVEAEVAPIITTGAAGATIPGLVGVAQRMASKLPGKGPQQFARGIAKANKLGDPVENEIDEIAGAVNRYNKGVETSGKLKDLTNRLKDIKKSFMEMDKQPGVHTEVRVNGEMRPISEMNTNAVIPMELGPAMRLVETNKVPDYAKALGVNPKNGVYVADDILSAYKKPINANVGIDDNGKFFITEGNDLLNVKGVSTLSPSQLKTYQSLFPARYAEAAASSPAMRAGYTFGSKLGEYGGVTEATLKPVQVNDLFNLVVGDGLKKPTYQTTNVYKDNAKLANKLDSDTKASASDREKYMKAKVVKDLFDLVFKKKEEDEDE